MKKDLLDKGAILQRDKETYAIVPHLTAGIVTPDQLRKFADVAEKYNVDTLKLTGAQRIAMIGIKEDEIDKIWDDLGMNPGASIGLRVRSVKVCPGTTFCKRGIQDSLTIGSKLDELYHGKELPNKFKMGISGCPQSCADNHIKDIGLYGSAKGWAVQIGGKGGLKPRFGDRIAMNVPEEKIFDLVEKIIQVYANNATAKERFGDYIDRIGIEEVKKQIDINSYL